MEAQEIAVRLGVAMLFGGLIGFERQWRQRMAGLRTNSLVAIKIARKVARKNLPELFIVGIGSQALLLFPLLRLKITRLPFQHTASKDPRRRRRQHLDAFEQCPVLEHAPARNKLSESPAIDFPQFRPHREYRLRFDREIESLPGLVIISPMHSITIIEERRCASRTVSDDSLKSSIQASGKSSVVLVHVNEMSRSRRI